MPFNRKTFKDYVYNELNVEARTRNMGDRALFFEDKDGRKIKISPEEGIYAEDSSGTVIHDTPDCLVAADMTYGGHVYFKDAANYFGNDTILHTTTGGGTSVYSALHNTDMTAYLPSDLTNVRALLLSIENYIEVPAVNCDDPTNIIGRVHYTNVYNSSANSSYNSMSYLKVFSQSASGDAQTLKHTAGSMAIAPVVYSATVPYLTWWNAITPANITTSTGNTIAQDVNLFLLGFLV